MLRSLGHAGEPVEDRVRAGDTILLVEDERDVADCWSKWVRSAGWAVSVAATVASGRAALRTRIDGILLDLGLPDGSGFDVMETARQRDPDVHVLVATTSLTPTNINRAQALGAEYACEPITSEIVERFLARCGTSSRKRLADLVAGLLAEHGSPKLTVAPSTQRPPAPPAGTRWRRSSASARTRSRARCARSSRVPAPTPWRSLSSRSARPSCTADGGRCGHHHPKEGGRTPRALIFIKNNRPP
jgi:CheY-like chemotaxis protein